MVADGNGITLAEREDPGSGVGSRKYNRALVDLSVARSGPDELVIAGCSLLVERLNGSLDLSFNNPEGELITLREGDVYYVDFTRVYLSNIAQPDPDTCKLLVGTAHGSFETVGASGRRPILVYEATGAAALALSTVENRRFKLVKVTVNFDTKPTTAEDVTLTLNAKASAAYDTVIGRATPSTGSGTGAVVFTGDDNDIFEEGDELDLAFTNTDTNTYGARIVTEAV